MKTKSAECASAIRKELKKEFPTIKFSVTSSNFSGGDSVDISWVDGVTDIQVSELVRKYQYGHFNSMDDIYELSNSREDIPQVKFVQTNRKISVQVSDSVYTSLRAKLSQTICDQDVKIYCYRICYKTSIPIRMKI
jgi:Large polyvalent protein associated domain 29